MISRIWRDVFCNKSIVGAIIEIDKKKKLQKFTNATNEGNKAINRSAKSDINLQPHQCLESEDVYMS